MALIGHSHVAATVGQFSLTSTDALCILLFNVQLLKQGSAESQRSKGYRREAILLRS